MTFPICIDAFEFVSHMFTEFLVLHVSIDRSVANFVMVKVLIRSILARILRRGFLFLILALSFYVRLQNYQTHDCYKASVLQFSDLYEKEIEEKAKSQGLKVCGRPAINPWNRKVKRFDIQIESPPEILSFVQEGGSGKPLWCVPKDNIAIIIPFRGREDQLK